MASSSSSSDFAGSRAARDRVALSPSGGDSRHHTPPDFIESILGGDIADITYGTDIIHDTVLIPYGTVQPHTAQSNHDVRSILNTTFTQSRHTMYSFSGKTYIQSYG